MNKRQLYIHLMHMRYLIYKDAIIKAIRSAHQEIADYKESVTEMIRRTR